MEPRDRVEQVARTKLDATRETGRRDEAMMKGPGLRQAVAKARELVGLGDG